MEKQGKDNANFRCEFCNKILTTNNRLLTHLKICKKKSNIDYVKEKDEDYQKKITEKDEKIKEYYGLIIQLTEREKQKDEYIKELKESLEKANQTIAEIAKQPKTTNNSDNRVHNQNYITNKFDINDITKISSVLENHLTPDVLIRGQEGVADMLKVHLLQTEKGEPIYECTDVARQKFEFRNSDGNIETDPKAIKLIRNLGRSGMWNKAHSTGKKLWEKEDGTVNYDAQTVFMTQVTEVLDIDKDSSKLRRHLASITARQRGISTKDDSKSN
jgi:phage FluMu protein Com